MENLTKEQQINKVKEWLAAALKPYQEIQDDRSRRYYDCQDDTLIGGISWKVTNETMRQLRNSAELKIEQIKNGGVLHSQVESLVLFDLDGNLVSDKIVLGKFGYCFIIENGDSVSFVGIAKKQSTYNKKGYECKTRFRTYEYNFLGKLTKKGNPIFENINLKNESFEDNISACYNNHSWIEYLYNSNQND